MSTLLVLDVEGTLFRSAPLDGSLIPFSVWQELARRLGKTAIAEELETHKRWDSGGYSNYLEWMEDTITIHLKHGLRRPVFEDVVSSAPYCPGVLDVFTRLDRGRFRPVLISGGFKELAARAQMDLRISHAFAACEYFFDEGGTLKHYNLIPCDFEGKLDFVRLMLRELGLGMSDWVFVGDGPNDVGLAQSAPVSIGYLADPKLRQVATYAIEDFRELLSLLDAPRKT